MADEAVLEELYAESQALAAEALQAAEAEILAQQEELNAASARLEAEHARYRELFEGAPIAYLVTDRFGITRFANRRAAAMLDVPARFLIPKPLLVFFEPGERALVRRILGLVAQDGVSRQFVSRIRNRVGPTDVNVARGIDTSAELELRWIIRDNADRERAEVAEEAVRQLSATVHSREEMFGLISHEVRTSLTLISGCLHVLARTEEAADVLELVHDSEREAHRLQATMANMLAIARDGHLPEGEPVLLQRLLPSVADRLSESLGRTVLFQSHGDLPPVLANSESVRQVVENLVGNADKYSPPGDPVAIEAFARGPDLIVSVADSGPGLAAHEYARVFEPFFRTGTARAVRGLGLGLTVCKRLVETYGGQIWAEPGAEGGSRFSFSLPSAHGEEAEPVDLQAQPN